MKVPSIKPLVMHLAPGQWAGHMRIYHRECMTLLKEGYRVALAAHPLPHEMLNQSVQFYSLRQLGNPSFAWRLTTRLQRTKNAYNFALHSGARLFHYHSPEFILWGLKLRKTLGRPLIFDCMEDFESYARQRPGTPNCLRPLLACLVRWQLRIAMQSCDAIIVADSGTGKIFQPYARRVVVLHNFPRLSLFPDFQRKHQEKLYDIIYHGGMPSYYLKEILGTDDILVGRGYRLRWRLFGRIGDEFWFRQELKRRECEDRFIISGLVPHDKIADEVQKAKVGIVPLPDFPKYQNNIPQKLFEYMALRIPVVMSDLPPSRPFIEGRRCAIAVPPGNYSAYADAIIQMIEDPLLCEQMGAEGRKLVEQNYNWEIESKKMLDLYSELLG
jgi:glycosyltransferase involved in cell wall biosynthesis